TPLKDDAPTTLKGSPQTPTVGFPVNATPPRSRRPLWMAGIALLLLVVFGGFFILSGTRPNAASQSAAIQPVAPGEYMVLVAPLQAVGTDARDVSQFISDDLKQQFEIEAPFSKIRVRQYPDVITSEEQAQAAAEAAGASVVLWGSYTADGIQLEVQLGSLAA